MGNAQYVDAVVNNVTLSPDGERNSSLYSAAFTFGGLIASNTLNEIEAADLLTSAALVTGLGEKETAATIRSGIEAGRLEPLCIDSDKAPPLTPAQLEENKRQRREAAEAKRQKQETALQRLRVERNDLVYHENLNGKTDYVKRKWGLTDDAIERFGVGYCHACPTSPYSDSITIPYYEQAELLFLAEPPKLMNLRHRLCSPNGQGKYRPEMAGLSSSIFNSDSLNDDGWIILVEGEFKAMVLWQYGFPVAATPGTAFKEEWVGLFAKVERVYVTLDPGAEKAALRTGKLLTNGGVDVRIVTVPHKPDDFFVIHGGTDGQFCEFLESGRTYEQALRGDTRRWTSRYGGAFGKLRGVGAR